MANRLPILAPNGFPARPQFYAGGHRRHYRQLDQNPRTRETIAHQPLEPSADVYSRARDAGREIYNEFPLARGIVNEVARAITTKVSTQYNGDNPDWGERALEWMRNHDKSIDFRGRPYDAGLLRFDIVRAPFTDSMIGVYLTEDQRGTPKIQLIHDDLIEEPIRNRFGTLVGYKTTLQDTPISVNDLIPVWVPGFHVAGRALSPLSLARFTWLDIGAFERNELFTGRQNASRIAVITNSEGEFDMPGDDADTVTTDTSPVYETQEFDGGYFDYIKSGEDIKAFDPGHRPSTNYQDFVSGQLSKVFHMMGLDLDYSLEQRETGGASIRVSADRTRSTMRFYFEHMVRRPQARIDSWRLAKAVKRGILPAPPDVKDFFAWDHAGGQTITADRKFQTQVDIMELESGLTTRAEIASSRGKDWEDQVAQSEREKRKLLSDKAARYDEAKALAGDDEVKLQHILDND